MREPSPHLGPPLSPPLPGDGMYRLILWLMVATVICGTILAIAGETLAQNQALSRLGAGMALIGGVVYAVFRWLGLREARRRQARAASDSQEANSADTYRRP